ncbi:hypothetical protein [Arthrobacter sedimenti]
MALKEHLREARNRLFKSAVAVILGPPKGRAARRGGRAGDGTKRE